MNEDFSHSVNEELALEDICPMCFGELDTGFECNNCGYDAGPLVADATPN